MQTAQTIICTAVFFAIYKLILEGKIAHSVARGYLVLSVVLSIAIPMLELPILPTDKANTEVISVVYDFIDPTTDSMIPEAVTEGVSNWTIALKAIYFIIVALLFVRSIISIIKIRKFRHNSELRSFRGIDIVASESITEPFSFGATIFINKAEKREAVLLHEYSHIIHHHTIERIFFEIARIAMWFNPFIHLISHSNRQVQEWQADRDVIDDGYDIYEYRQIIFHQLFGYSPDITCGLNNSLTKKRFIMMTSINRGKRSLLRISAVIPIVAAMVLSFGAVAAKAEKSKANTTITEPSEPKILIEVRKEGKEIFVNNEPTTLSQLPERIKQEEERVVTIDADQGTPMGVISDIKESIRGIEGLRINYAKPDALNSSPSTEPITNTPLTKGTSTPTTQIKKIEARNLLQVKVTTDGTILLSDKECSYNKLKREVKHFVQNYHIYAINSKRLHIGNMINKEYSSFSTTALTMADGSKVCCPVSNGIISLSYDKDTSFDAVRNALSAIELAYTELRQNLSLRVYNKSYDKLGSPYKEMIDNAVPIRVYIAE